MSYQGPQRCAICGKEEPEYAIISVNDRKFCLEHVPETERPDHHPETTRCMACCCPTAEWVAPRTYVCQRDECGEVVNFASDNDLASYVQTVTREEDEPDRCPDCGRHYLYREQTPDGDWFYIHATDPPTADTSREGIRVGFDRGCTVPAE